MDNFNKTIITTLKFEKKYSKINDTYKRSSTNMLISILQIKKITMNSSNSKDTTP